MNIKEVISDPRRRTILITIVAATILLVLLIALAITITGKSGKKFSNTPAESVAASTSTVADGADSAGIAEPDPSTSDTADIAAAEQDTLAPADNAGAVAATGSLPQTGPADILPLALLLGSLVAFLTSKKYATQTA